MAGQPTKGGVMFGNKELNKRYKKETGGYLEPDKWIQQKLDRIKELEVYARHFESCKSNVAIFGKAEHYPCTCGLDNLLNRGEATPPKDK